MLGKLDEHAASHAFPLLTTALQDDDADVRIRARNLLGDLGEHARAPLVKNGLPDPERSIREGEHAIPASELKDALRDQNSEHASEEAARSLGKLGKHALEVKEGYIRMQATELLGELYEHEALRKLGEHAAPAVPSLVKAALHNKDRDTPSEALQWEMHCRTRSPA
jgi:HEAT repeat protein